MGSPALVNTFTKKCVEWGFGYGKSEYEVSLGLAPRNGDLSPSDPETPEPFNSPLRERNPERNSDSNFPQNLGSDSNSDSKSKFEVPGHIKPEIKGQRLNLHFFGNGE